MQLYLQCIGILLHVPKWICQKECGFTREVGVTLEARRQSRAVGVCVTEDAGVEVGVGLQAYNQP